MSFLALTEFWGESSVSSYSPSFPSNSPSLVQNSVSVSSAETVLSKQYGAHLKGGNRKGGIRICLPAHCLSARSDRQPYCHTNTASSPGELRFKYYELIADSRDFSDSPLYRTKKKHTWEGQILQKTADVHRKLYQTTGTCRKPQIVVSPLRFVHLSAALFLI